MATFLDDYKALDTVPQQKAQSYQFLTSNRDKLSLSPDEEYKFNWGDEALTEDWINSKVAEIQNSVENSNSTNILRRGLGKDEVAKTPDQEVAEQTATDASKATGNDNGGGGDGSTPSSTPAGSTTPDSVSASGIPGFSSLSMTTQEGLAGAAKGGLTGLLSAGPLGLAIGGYNGYNSAADAQTNREATATEARQITRMQELAEEQHIADAVAAQQSAALGGALSSFGSDAGMGPPDSSSGPNGTGLGGGYGNSPGEGRL